MSIYIQLEEDEDESTKVFDMRGVSNTLYDTKTHSNTVPPAPSYTVPQDDRFQGYGDALFGAQQEYTRPMRCQVAGNIPPWLRGSFIRVGPGRFKWGDTECGHFFDGDGIAHRFTFDHQGSVVYQSKFLETEYHRKNEKYNRISCTGFATWAPPDPCANIFRRMVMYFIPHFNNDNVNVNVFNIHGKTYVATETPWMVEMDPHTLERIKEVNGRRKVPESGIGSWLAHPHFEEDGSTWMFSTLEGQSPKYELLKIPPAAGPSPFDDITTVCSLDCPNGAGYYHSFGITENFVILVVNPWMMEGKCELLTMNICHKSVSDVLQFKPEYGIEFRIIEKKSGKELRSCKAEALFVFHHANAFEKDGELILDMSAHPDDGIVKEMYMKNLKNDFKGLTITPPNLVRFRIPLKEIWENNPEPYVFPAVWNGGRDHEILAQSVEGPVINYDMVNGKQYTFVWGIVDFIYTPRLSKTNVKTKETIYWNPPPKTIPALPWFIADPNGVAEDDGLLVTNCTGVDDVQSFLLILDAKTMSEMARANMPVGIGYGIHANFFPER